MDSPRKIEERILLSENSIYNSEVFFNFADCHFKHREKDDFDLYSVYLFRLDLFDKNIKEHFMLLGYDCLDKDIFCKDRKPKMSNPKVKKYVLENSHSLSLYVGKTCYSHDGRSRLCPFFLSICKDYRDNDVFDINGFTVKVADANDSYFSGGPYCKLFSIDGKKRTLLDKLDSDIFCNIKKFSENTAKFLEKCSKT